MLRLDEILNRATDCPGLLSRKSLACLVFLAVVGMAADWVHAAEPLREFRNCQWIDESWADGDSFHVRFPEVVGGSRDHVVRLYFVDCPESVARQASDVDRLREQSRYFGVKDPLLTMAIGKEAAAFAKAALSKPFTVWTRFANARGRAAKPRVYAVVVTSDGRSLDEALVRNGLAQNKGVRTGHPDGLTLEQHRRRLDSSQTEAILTRTGIWKHSDPLAIVPGRAVTLQQERERQAIIKSADAQKTIKGLRVDPNTASPEEIQQLPGIGPELADRLIEHRPYKRVEDLSHVPGIGPKTVTKLRPYLRFGKVP